MPEGFPKFTEQVKTRILNAIELGATYEHASNYGGISRETLRDWVRRGEDEESPEFVEFYEQVQEAEGRAVVQWLAKIEKAANDGQWQAAAWKLERRYPQIYGKSVVQNEHSGGVQTGVMIVPGRVTEEEWEERFGQGARCPNASGTD